MQVLVKHGADPTIKDDYGHDALYAAVTHGQCNNLYEDELGIDPTEFNDIWGELDPLKGLEDKLLYLLHAGCDSAAIDNAGQTIQSCAKQEGLSKVWDAALSRFNEERDLMMGED